MTANDDLIVGIIALALVPVIAWRIWRGVRHGRLLVYRTGIARDDDRAKFAVLLGLHVLSMVAVALIGADLLLGLGLRD